MNHYTDDLNLDQRPSTNLNTPIATDHSIPDYSIPPDLIPRVDNLKTSMEFQRALEEASLDNGDLDVEHVYLLCHPVQIYLMTPISSSRCAYFFLPQAHQIKSSTMSALIFSYDTLKTMSFPWHPSKRKYKSLLASSQLYMTCAQTHASYIQAHSPISTNAPIPTVKKADTTPFCFNPAVVKSKNHNNNSLRCH